jgi:murein DD-endopeptidase MepM/ murein hydrolase activator NlpD
MRATDQGGEVLSRIRLVLRHVGNGFSFIVAPHGTGRTVTFNLPGRLALLLLILIVVFFAGLAFVGVTYTRLALLAFETGRLEKENEMLRLESNRIGEIEQELAAIENMSRQIGAWAGIVPDRITEEGAGDAYDFMPNVWPRRYTYAIMKPFYAQRAAYPHAMVAPAMGWVSRRYIGEEGKEAVHPGIDIAASTGTPVRCALGGVVKSAGWDDIYGNLIVVEHNDSLATVYGHNEKILVKEGDNVTRGQVIATIGSTGRSTAPHLHFEVLKNQKAVDPELYIRFDRQ